MKTIIDNIQIKYLTENDYEELIKLWTASGLHIKPEGRDSKEKIQTEITSDFGTFIGAYDNEKLIGVIIATFDGRKGWLNRLAVHPDYRRHGIGKLLINEGENYLKTKKSALIIGVLIEDWNEPSLKLSQKMGFFLHKDISYLSKRDNDNV